jgi:hypothetical protein
MAVVSTQSLTEMGTRNFPGGKGRQAHEADNLTAICDLIVLKMREPRPSRPAIGIAFFYPL